MIWFFVKNLFNENYFVFRSRCQPYVLFTKYIIGFLIMFNYLVHLTIVSRLSCYHAKLDKKLVFKFRVIMWRERQTTMKKKPPQVKNLGTFFCDFRPRTPHQKHSSPPTPPLRYRILFQRKHPVCPQILLNLDPILFLGIYLFTTLFANCVKQT